MLTCFVNPTKNYNLKMFLQYRNEHVIRIRFMNECLWANLIKKCRTFDFADLFRPFFCVIFELIGLFGLVE